MLLLTLAVALAVALTLPSDLRHADPRLYRPPVEYRTGDVRVYVHRVDVSAVARLCRVRGMPAGVKPLACTWSRPGAHLVPVIILPEEGRYSPEMMARIEEHEYAHARGWTQAHEGAVYDPISKDAAQ